MQRDSRIVHFLFILSLIVAVLYFIQVRVVMTALLRDVEEVRVQPLEVILPVMLIPHRARIYSRPLPFPPPLPLLYLPHLLEPVLEIQRMAVLVKRSRLLVLVVVVQVNVGKMVRKVHVTVFR